MLTLSNENLIAAIRSLVKEERRISREVLDHINEVSRRRLYADLGFASVFEWLVKDLGYSESAAYRRMQAARLLQAVPGAAAKLETGKLSLTVLSKVQTLIRADEKRTGERLSSEVKADILATVESCSGREAEFRLASRFPEAEVSKEKVRAISEDHVSVQLTLTREQFEKLKRIRELLSHTPAMPRTPHFSMLRWMFFWKRKIRSRKSNGSRHRKMKPHCNATPLRK